MNRWLQGLPAEDAPYDIIEPRQIRVQQFRYLTASRLRPSYSAPPVAAHRAGGMAYRNARPRLPVPTYNRQPVEPRPRRYGHPVASVNARPRPLFPRPRLQQPAPAASADHHLFAAGQVFARDPYDARPEIAWVFHGRDYFVEYHYDDGERRRRQPQPGFDEPGPDGLANAGPPPDPDSQQQQQPELSPTGHADEAQSETLVDRSEMPLLPPVAARPDYLQPNNHRHNIDAEAQRQSEEERPAEREQGDDLEERRAYGLSRPPTPVPPFL